MLQKLRPRSAYDVMAAIACFGVLAGGTAYAANTIATGDIIDNQVTSPDVRDDSLGFGGLFHQDLAPGSVRSSEVLDDSLTGADVSESTLQGVNASAVSGLNLRKISFVVPFGTPQTIVLDLRGLRIQAECQPFGDFLDVKAISTKDDASIQMMGSRTANRSDTDTTRDIDGAAILTRDFDTGYVLEVDNQIPPSPSDGVADGVGTLHYHLPDGTFVIVDLALELDGGGCAMTGVAIGG